MSKLKKRLDLVVQEQFPHLSRQHIQSLIMQGKVVVENKIMTKPGTAIAPDAPLQVHEAQPKYVSRAGYKLEKALEYFTIDVTKLTVLDAGISTGGFTDCLLQHGAAKVYGVDVGYGQVHEKIRHDPRTIVLEKTNIRTLSSVGELIDMVTLDLSFISVLKVLEAVHMILKPEGKLIILIKPQFEASKAIADKFKGVISDERTRTTIVQKVIDDIQLNGFMFQGVTPSPIEGGSGNIEYLAYFTRI